MRARFAWLLAGLAGSVGCTHDFGVFDVQRGGANADAASSGGARTDAGATGGASGSGSGGTAGSAGTGGVPGGGAGGLGLVDSGSGGATDARAPNPDAGSGGSRTDAGSGGGNGAGGGTDSGGGCLPTEKLCGTCVAKDSPGTGCAAASCLSCSVPNAITEKCVSGECAADVCQGGYGDCNGIASDGCEHDVTADPLQCGACSRACAADHIAGRVCNAGGCTSSCELGRANCTRPTTGPDDGCELDASGDAKNCGGCSNDCTQQNGKVCQNGLCSCGGDTQCRSGAVQGTATCDTGTGLCACNGTTCRHGESCRQGACACNAGPACTGTQTCCRTPTGCRDLTSDAANCGACGHACTPGFSCSGSACVCEDAGDCNAGTPGTCSGGVCHCGASTCTAGQRCLPNGQCG